MVNPQSLPERHKDFWELFVNNWEKENRGAFSSFIDSDTAVIDLGAWVGPFTLFSAALGAKHVYAFEPDKCAHQFLNENYSVNPKLQNKITLFDFAIAKDEGILKIGPLLNRPLGDSTTTTNGINLSPVSAISVDTMLNTCHINTTKKICIKIDIEGSEKDILEDLINRIADIDKPFLIIIEFHPFCFTTEDSQRVEKAIKKLISISDKFSFKQRRRIGEVKTYPDVDTEWTGELYHPNGLFDITFHRS